MKALKWTVSSLKDLKAMPEEVQDDIGYALFIAQVGKSTRMQSRFRDLAGPVS